MFPLSPASNHPHAIAPIIETGVIDLSQHTSLHSVATLYNWCMRGWSIPLGRWMGVELRVHTFFLLLAVVCLGLGASDSIARGIGLFMTLVVAVVVREIARLLVAAWLG